LSTRDALLLELEVAFHEANPLDQLPRGVIHADLFRDNVLLDGERVGGLIDFYFACNDCLLYDVAITVNDWCMSAEGELDPERTRAFLQAYHAARPFTELEVANWSTALRVGALRFWISRLFDLHQPRDGEMVHAHNPDQFKRILQRHIATGTNAVWL
jgi:homoserine kinase type II